METLITKVSNGEKVAKNDKQEGRILGDEEGLDECR